MCWFHAVEGYPVRLSVEKDLACLVATLEDFVWASVWSCEGAAVCVRSQEHMVTCLEVCRDKCLAVCQERSFSWEKPFD